jgi:L-phenylalanine/L-methionine N-acetyltransferase
MTTKEDLIYRQVFTLKDGARVLVRPLTSEDRQLLLDLFLPVGPEDKRYIRHDINDPSVVESWIDALDYENVLPIVAVVNNRIVGVASLHFRGGPARHRAEVRIFLAKDFRQRGVGTRMLSGLIDLARRRSLYLLEVEIVSDQSHIIKAFHNLGFETKCILEDFFMMPDGDLRDVYYLVLRLQSGGREF